MAKSLVIFTGAGFTKGIWTGAPLGDDLLKRIFEEFDQFAEAGINEPWTVCNDVLGALFDGVKNKESLNLELLLGLLYRMENTAMDAQLRRRAAVLWEWISAALGRAVHYSLTITDTLTPPRMASLHRILKGCQAHFHRTSIVTTNYDLIVDKINQLIIDSGSGYDDCYKPHNTCGKLPPDLKRYQYGIPVSAVFRVEKSGGQARDLETVINEEPYKHWEDISEAIHIYKLHGSVNWAHCESCKEEIHLAARRVDLNRVFNLEEVRCVHHDKPYRSVIIPPMAVKQHARDHPVLDKIWNTAEEVLSAADIVLFIGYSLPLQDPYVAELIIRSRASARKQGHDWRYWVIDCDPEVHVRFEQIFGKAEVNEKCKFHPVLFEMQYLAQLIKTA